MGLLKLLVVLLTTLITLAIGLLVYGFVKKAGDPNWRFISEPKNTGAIALSQPPSISSAIDRLHTKPWGDVNLALPSECWISDVKMDDRRLYLTIQPLGNCHRVVIIDSTVGRVLGSVKLSR